MDNIIGEIFTLLPDFRGKNYWMPVVHQLKDLNCLATFLSVSPSTVRIDGSSLHPVLKGKDGVCISGLVSVAKQLVRSSSRRDLLGNSPEEMALINQWTEYRIMNFDRCSKDRDLSSNLKELNDYLVNRVFLVGHHLTLADVLLYQCLHQLFEHLTFYEKQQLLHLSRWFNQVVVIRLTDEKDLLFLYHMRMTEDEYRNFKEERHLVFGFDDFPQFLVEYLDCCIAQDNDDDHELFAQLTFTGAERAEFHVMQYIKLPVSDRMPKSIGKNVKRDSILPLDLLRGTDNDVKCYLANCLRVQQDQNLTLIKRINDLENNLSETQSALASRIQELSGVASNYTAKMNGVLAQHNEELNAERQKSQQLQSALQQRCERERKELEQAHLKIVKEWEARVREIDASNRELMDCKYKQESTIRDLSMKLNSLEEENQRMRTDLQAVRTDYSALGSDRSEQEREVAQLRMKVAMLEQDVRAKSEQSKRVTDDLTTERDAKRKLEDELERKRRQLRDQAAIIKEKANDINKANEIIGRLQTDNMAFHSEVKVRRMTIVEQEKVMNEKVQKLEDVKREVDAAMATLKLKDIEINELKDKFEEAVQKLRESRDKIKENENVIQYLSRNMNEMQLSQRPPPGMFEMASRVPLSSSGPRIPGTNVAPYTTMVTATSIGASSHFSTPASGTQYSPANVLSGRASSSNMQVQGLVRNDVPVPVNKSTPVAESVLTRSSPHATQTSQQREGIIDPKYFQSDSIPSRPAVVSGGGSALAFAGSSDNFSRRVKDSMPHPSTAGRPASQNAVEIQTRSAQSVQQPLLASSYFPVRNS